MIFIPDPAQNAFLKAWLEKRLCVQLLGECHCFGILRDKKLIAVSAFRNYGGFDIEVLFAADSPRWASKEMLAWIFSYPFIELKTQRVTALAKKSNRRVRKLLLGIGFREEGAHRHATQNLETVFSYGMTRLDYVRRYGKFFNTTMDRVSHA